MKKWLTRKIFPAMHKAPASQHAIIKAPLPTELRLPLLTPQHQLLVPIVKVGQTVLKNQILTRTDDLAKPPIHAPTSGIVTAITEIPIVNATVPVAPAIIIEADGLDQAIEPDNDDWHTLTSSQLAQKCHLAGIVGLGGAGFPSAVKMTQAKIETLVINGVECEPYITADDRLMQEYAADIIQGALLLQKIVQAQTIIIAIENNKLAAISQIKAAIDERVQLHIIPNGYPSGSEKQLIHYLSGIEIPAHRLPREFGFVMFNVGTAKAVRDAIVDNQPLISRIVTLTGPGVSQPRNLEVRIGTPMAFLLDGIVAHQVTQGGSLMGMVVENLQAPVTKVTNCLLVAPNPSRVKKEHPCIRCGLCANVCPVYLLPQQLYWFAQGKQYEAADDHHLLDCIECGACAYVCPSDISLVDYYRQAKQALKKIAQEQEQAALAKQRFDARNLRLAQAAERAVIVKEQVVNPLAAADKKSVILAALAKAREKKAKPVT